MIRFDKQTIKLFVDHFIRSEFAHTCVFFLFFFSFSRQLSSEMNACREELSDMEKELLQLRRDSSSKATQLSQMEETLQETRGMLDKKSEMGTR